MYEEWKTIYKDDVYHMQISLDKGVMCVHCLVTGRVNGRNLKNIRAAFEEMCYQLEDMGYFRIYASVPNTKFARLVTGDTFHEVAEIGGCPFIVWEFEEYLYG